jgi:hypothetical protein
LNVELGSRTGLEYVVRPPTLSATTRPPLLCFLHGFDEGPPTAMDSGVMRHGPLAAGASRLAGNFVVVAPQLPVRGDYWHRHVTAMRDVVDEACKRFDADRDRAYLTGFSYGGNGVFDLAVLPGVPWAALWPVDPTRAPREPLTPPVWLSVGEVTRAGLPRFIRSMQLVPWARKSAPPRVYVDEGDDHVGVAARAYADDRIYEWLLRWTSRTA